MKSLLICEGKTDSIVLSYYLNKEFGWEYDKDKNNDKNRIRLKKDDYQTENTYKKAVDELTILSVGGCSRYEETISRILDVLAKANDNQNFDKVIVVSDKDNYEVSELESDFSRFFNISIKNQEWVKLDINTSFGEKLIVDVLLIIIPDNGSGAIETLLINSIGQIGHDEQTVVEATEQFIEDFNLAKYLLRFRDRLKSKLSTVIGILEPEKTFTHVDGMIRGIEWTVTDEVRKVFSKLSEL